MGENNKENSVIRNDGMVPGTASLGGAGDTDDLVVVGMVDAGDGGPAGGIGVIGTDNGMTRQPRRDPKPKADMRAKAVTAEAGATRRQRRPPKADGAVGMATGGSQDAIRGGGAPKAKKPKGSSVAPKVIVVLLVVLVAALAGVWAYGRSHYSEHLFPGLMVDGVNVSGMTAQEATDATSVDRWSFTVDDMGERYELGAEDVGFQTEEIDYAKIIADQDVNLWFMHVISPQSSESIRESTYDTDAVKKSVAALPCLADDREKPVDAEARKAEDGLSYEIVPEKEGNTVKASVIEDAVEEALAHGKNGSISLEEAGAYVRPLVYASDESIKSAVETANKWMRTNITYDIDGLDSVETLGPETISQWVSVERSDPEQGEQQGEQQGEEKPSEENPEEAPKDDDAKEGSARQVFGRAASGDEGGMFRQVSETTLDDGIRADDKGDDRPKPTFQAVFDDEALRGWLSGIGDEYDTAGKPRTITTPTGKVAEVRGGGAYGWITDEASEFEAVKSSMDAGETVHREFATKQRAALPKGQNEWGNTYIEIDLSDQHLWYIRNGETILSYGVITGKRGYETPTMVSQVYAKQTDVTLVSPWKDPKTGEPTYKTHIDVGLVISDDYQVLCHDAPWQPSSGFGSSSYHWSGGSHGCCNMRAGDCWELYNTASVGDPVIVHY